MSREKELEIVNNATPGPWVETYAGSRTIIGRDHQIVVDALNDGTGAGVVEQPDAEFIATFNPARVRELLQENHELEERHSLERLEIERLRSDLESAKDLADDYNEEILASHARLAAVEKLHVPAAEHQPSAANCRENNGLAKSGRRCLSCSDGWEICTLCGETWPCVTIKAARGE